MLQKVIISLAILLLASCENTPKITQEIISTDIDNYWIAYDKIVATEDSATKYQYLNDFFINKGSVGLKNMIAARNYTTKNYIDAINNYPKFWSSIRENTLKTKEYDSRINTSIQKLKDLYPDLKPAPIYHTIGSFRAGGTIYGKTVLIGCELSFADKSTIIDELPEWRQPFYQEYNPIEGIELLCTHEYVHTQQAEMVDNLLTYCLYEGVAEFVSTQALAVPSNTPAIQFGKEHAEAVLAKFEEDMFISQNTFNWIWGENQNELKVRDLGYYIGYAICEKYYDQSTDKKLAIKEMIELNFSDEDQIEAFVDGTNFLSKSLNQLYENFQKTRPIVLNIEPSINNSQNVSPSLKQITLGFSEAMNKESRGFDFGPLGEEHVLRVQKVIGYSEDGKSFTFEVELEPNKHYQSLITNRFLAVNGTPLKPYLIDFKTAKE